MKTTIAIIGATGNMGKGLSHNFAKAGFRVLLMGRDTVKLQLLFDEIKQKSPNADVDIVYCPVDASWEADIIIPAVDYSVQNEVMDKIKNVVIGKIIISIVNPLNTTFDGLLTSPQTSAAEEMQALLPHSKVVKAFNTVLSGVFSSAEIGGQTPDCFVAGDDEDAVTMVSHLVQQTGFNPLIAGNLAMSRTLENMMVLLIGLSMRYNYDWLAGWKVLHDA